MYSKYVSVIIPCYNKEKMIRTTLDSLVKQTMFNNMYIICVDDCSTDKTYSILEKYSRKYSNITSIKLKKNSSVYEARRIGLNYSQTPYVGFVDPDDIVTPSYYETLYTVAVDTDADIVCLKNIIINDKYGQYRDTTKNLLPVGIYDRGENDEEYFATLLGSGWLLLWNKLFKRSVLDDYIYGGEFYTNFVEDTYISIISFINSNRFVNIDGSEHDAGYIYNLDENVDHMSLMPANKKKSDWGKLVHILTNSYLIETGNTNLIPHVMKWRKHLMNQIIAEEKKAILKQGFRSSNQESRDNVTRGALIHALYWN